MWCRTSLLLGLFLALTTTTAAQESSAMRTDVVRMIRAAHKVDRLMPWSEPVREIDRVVRHGKAVVPLLIRLLPDDPMDLDLFYDSWDEQKVFEGKQFDSLVEQNTAVALCRIYHVAEPKCPVFLNRETREGNKAVKVFFLKKKTPDNSGVSVTCECPPTRLHRFGGEGAGGA